ncbi:hypothetical protein NPIL_372701 [Nephila pilipes]|uniref:Uncharacterized protein n=1 Tax=Nephila pilipes TaxID=299642 RepID=A0A8X6UCY1_NEPPI|nr:hypothetical protein NPIL_372701 [Nephila pilipes]
MAVTNGRQGARKGTAKLARLLLRGGTADGAVLHVYCEGESKMPRVPAWRKMAAEIFLASEISWLRARQFLPDALSYCQTRVANGAAAQLPCCRSRFLRRCA